MQAVSESGVEVILAVLGDQEAVASLLSAYLLEIGAAPTYPYLPLYWSEPGRYPYLVKIGGELVGFALVRSLPLHGQIEMAEFYVVPSKRRQGVGYSAARAVMARHLGEWSIRPLPGSTVALAFWQAVIAPNSTHDA
jgi:predicted acetyltransferase